MPIENKIRAVRKERKLTQRQLAQRCGVGQSTISETEKGTHIPTVELALLLAQALGVTVEELFYLVE